MPDLEAALEDGIRSIGRLSVLTLFYLIFASFCFDVRADLSSNPVEATSPIAADLGAKLAGPVSLIQIGNNPFMITPLRIIVGVIVVLVVFFVIALRKRWIEIGFESVPEEGLSVEGEDEREVDERLPSQRRGGSEESLQSRQGAVEPSRGLAVETELSSEKDVSRRMLETISPESLGRQVVMTELERIEAEIDKARNVLEVERVKLEKASQNLAGEYEALRRVKEELSAEKEKMTFERQRLERLREQLTHEQTEMGKARDELAEVVKVLSKTSLKGLGG